MKQKIYTIGVATVVTVFAGAIFKVNHYPGAAVLLIAGIASLLLLFLPLALISHYRSAEENKSLTLHIVIYITCLLVFTAMLFKLLHWPYAGLLLTIALPFPYLVFLPVFVYITSRDKNFNIYNTVFVLLLLALNSVFSGLLSLNVTSEKIKDSYWLPGNYNKQESALTILAEKLPSSEINDRIDGILNTVNQIQDIILSLDGKGIEEWKLKPGNLQRPDIAGSVTTIMSDVGLKSIEKLYSDLNELIVLMKTTPGYKQFADNQEILFRINASTEEEWAARNFNDFRAWTLTYLDLLQVNLLTIKVSGPV
ncbi:MAG: hypothetical protein HZB98_00525 [Bacteroidia bacterium]|nr:hypothetical protein [Bacteroidia bacterium]